MTTSRHSSPRSRAVRSAIEKIVIGAGVGRASQLGNFTEKVLPQVVRDLALISGQRPQTRAARRSIAGFKLREGQTVGLKVTLRGPKMVDFFERLITIVLPRVRDFNGLDPKSIDEGGVLNIGFREQMVFPEVNAEESPFVFSLGVSVVPIAKDPKEALRAYEELGVPLKNKS